MSKKRKYSTYPKPIRESDMVDAIMLMFLDKMITEDQWDNIYNKVKERIHR
jgi:hypothetical protein